MTSHRMRDPRTPVPNWLKVFYATLIFLAFVLTLSLVLHK